MAFSFLLDAVIETVDGSKHPVRIDLPGNYAARCAFEVEFRQSSATIGRAIAELAKATADMDMSNYLRDSWIGFYAWREWRRSDPSAPASFAEFGEVVEEVSVTPVPRSTGEELLDPTGPGDVSGPAAPLG